MTVSEEGRILVRKNSTTSLSGYISSNGVVHNQCLLGKQLVKERKKKEALDFDQHSR